MKKIFFNIILIVLSISVFSQNGNKAYHWYFGVNAGVDFSTGIPVAKTDGQLTGWEGCATVDDKNGNFLFYTDGQKVYNRNHQVMPNGSGLMGHWSASQSSIIVPCPGNDSLFYIFTVDAIDNHLQNGLRYSVVNMHLNGGLGDVTSTKNILLETPVTERLFAIMHSNNLNVWVIAHRWDSNEYVAYKISSTGVSTTPVVSAIGTVITGGYSGNANVDGWTNAIGQIKANINGTKIATTLYKLNKIDLLNFDKSTGILSNCFSSNDTYNLNYFGIEFSTNSNYLYVSNCELSSVHSKLYQFDITQTNPFENPVLLSSGEYGSGAGMAHLQIAPNGKIYVVDDLNPYLGVINEPNKLGLDCDYQEQAVYLEGKKARRGLPNLFYYKGFHFITGSEKDTSICEGDSIYLENTYQTEANTYYDTLHSSLGWDSIINTHLTILPVATSPTISENDGVLTSSSANNYQWYYNGNIIVGAINQQYQPFVSGIYKVLVDNENGCFSSSAEYNFVYTQINKLTEYGIEIYPNPVKTKLTIKNSNINIKNITIYDAIGNKIRAFQTKNIEILIDFSEFEKGVYILQFSLVNSETVNYKVIKD